MSIVAWILFGLVTGIIASALDPTPSRGNLVGAIILGIIGALAGGFLGNIAFGMGVTGFNLPSITVAVLGALLVLFIWRAINTQA